MSPSILFLFSRDGYIVSFNGMIFETKLVIALSFQQWFKKIRRQFIKSDFMNVFGSIIREIMEK